MRRTVLPVAALALAAALAAPAPAAAQIGGLIKKAAKKAVDKQESASGGMPSSAFGPELTEQSLTAVLKGLEAQDKILGQRDAVAKQHDALMDARTKLLSPHDAEHQAFDAATDKWNQCRDQAFEKIRQQMQAAMGAYGQKLAADPAKFQQFQQEMMAVQMKSMQLMQKGDTAGAMKLSMDFARKQAGVSGDARSDTAQVEKTCGPGPVKPAWLAQADADWNRADTLNTQIRDLESKAEAAGESTSGLSATAYGNARERLINWYRGTKDGHPVQQFSDTELRLFKEHQGEIEKLERVL